MTEAAAIDPPTTGGSPQRAGVAEPYQVRWQECQLFGTVDPATSTGVRRRCPNSSQATTVSASTAAISPSACPDGKDQDGS